MSGGEDPALRRARAAAPAVALAAALAAVALVLLWPAGPAASSRLADNADRGPLPPLLPGASLEQRFVATDDRLRSIEVRPLTYGNRQRCRLHLRLEDGRGRLLGRAVRNCASLTDGVRTRLLEVDPVVGSTGRTYRLRITSDRRSSDAVTFERESPSTWLPHVALAGATAGDALDVAAYYGRGRVVADLAPEAVERLGQYRAGWQRAPAPALTAGAALLALVAAAVVRGRAAVVALLALATLKGVFWTILVPPLEAPDENAHYAYAQHVAEQRRIPDRDDPLRGLEEESEELRAAAVVFHQHHRPLADRPFFGAGERGPDEGRLEVDRDVRSSGAGAAAGYSPAYYLPAAALYGATPATGFAAHLAAMRLWSVALGVLAVWLALLIGREALGPSSSAPVALALAVAVHPVFSQQTAAVNNDALVIVGGFLTLLLALRAARADSPWRPALFLGGAVGLALHGKPFAAALLPLIAVVGAAQTRRPDGGWRRGLRTLVGAGVGLVATYGTWFVVAILLGRPSTSFVAGAPEGPTSLASYVRVHLVAGGERPRMLWVDSFWGFLSWFDTSLPRPLLDAALVLTLASGALVAGAALRWALTGRSRRRGGDDDERRDQPSFALLLAAVAVGGMILGLHAIEFALYGSTGRLDLLQGRYLLLVLPAVLLLPVLALRDLVPRLSVAVTSWTLAGGAVVLHLAAVATLLRRFYL